MKRTQARVFNLLDSQSSRTFLDLDGFAFILHPNTDPAAWKALEYYASITPNVAQRQAILVWLRQHPDPSVPVAEQLEMAL